MKNLFILIIIFLFSCGEGRDEKEFTLIKNFRIISIVAEPPETKPNQPINLSGLIVDPEGRDLSSAWFISVDPYQKNFEANKTIPIGNGEKIIYTPTLPTGKYNVFLVSVAQKVFPDDPNQIEGLPHAIARKEIIISENNSPDKNPVIKSISFDPNFTEINPGDRIWIKAETDPLEKITFSWLSPENGLQNDFDNPVEWIAPEDFIKTTIYLIIRNPKGGQANRIISLPK